MDTWHNRLEKALEVRGKGYVDLIKATGLTPQSVYKWSPTAESRTGMLNADNAAKVCEYLNISVIWLFLGKGDSGLEDTDQPPIANPEAHAALDTLIALKPSYWAAKIITLAVEEQDQRGRSPPAAPEVTPRKYQGTSR